MFRSPSTSLRTRLVLLVRLALIPAFGLLLVGVAGDQNGRVAGIPTHAVMTPLSDRPEEAYALALGMIGLGLVALLAIVAASYLIDLLLVRRANARAIVAEQPGTGSMRAPTGQSFGKRERGVFARQFDTMAGALPRRAANRNESAAALRKWADLFQSTPVGFAAEGPDGRFFGLMNRAFAEMHGYSIEELKTKSIQDLISPDERANVAEQMRILLDQGHHVFETRHVRKDGSVFPVLVDAAMVRDGPGNVLQRFVSVQDISQLRRVEQADREQRVLAEALHDTAAALNSTLNFGEVLNRILDNVGRVVPHDAADIMLVESDVARPIGCRGYAERGVETWFLAQRFRVAGFPRMRQMLETGQSILIADVRDYPAWVDLPETRWIRSLIGMPIRVKERVVGILNIASTTPGFFDETHLARIQVFADQVAIALENARLLAETEQRANQFSALYDVAHDLATQRDVPGLLQTIVDRAMALLSAPCGFIYSYDPRRNDLELAVEKGFDTPIGTRLQMGEGMAGRVAQERRPLIVDDYRSWEHRAAVYREADYSAVIEVPMFYGGELFGVLGVAQIGAPSRRYTDADAHLLTLFAAQAASAVHNARLLQETNTRAEQLGLLYDAGLTLNRVLDPREQLEFLFKIATKALNAERAEFFRYDASTHQLRTEMSLGYTNEKARDAVSRLGFSLEEKTGMVSWVARHRVPLNVGDVQAAPGWIVIDPELRSGVWVPIQHENELLGVLGVLSTRLNAFSPQDERLLVLFANQVATAMENARLFNETRRRADQLAAINRIARAANQTLDLDNLLEVIFEEVTALFQTDAFYIALYDAATHELDYRIRVDEGTREPPQRRAVGTGLSSRVIESQKPLLVRDWEKEKDHLPLPMLWGTLKSPQSWLGVPMRIGTTVVGILCVQAYTPNVYDEEEERLLTTIADQVAVVVQNVRLFNETLRRLGELEAMNRISIALRLAKTVEEMAPLLLDETLAAFKMTTGQIAFYDPSTDELRVAAARGWFADTLTVAPANDGIAGRVFETGQPCVTREFKSDPATSELARAQIPAGWGGAIVPIRTGQEVTGVLDLAVPLPREITPDEVRLLLLIAEIAGTAIHRATLHEQTEQRLQRLDALHTIDTAIGASLDLRVTLNVLLDQVLTQLRVDAADVLLLNPYTQVLEYSAARGFHTNVIEHTRVRLGQEFAGRVAIERRTLFIPDLAAGDAATKCPELMANETFVSYCAAPLIAKGQIKGVLEIFHRRALKPDSEWLDFVETLAGQTAIAVDNAALFDSLQRSNFDISLAYDATIEGWARSLDLRDPESRGRSQRVTDLTLRLARALGMSDVDLIHVRRGALLHHIGKMGIPDSIVFKPSPRTDGEQQIVRRHPTVAYEILSPIAYLRPAMDIPYCHHENWDGTGYPRGLQGEQIPLAARIFAVANAWDEISSHPDRAASSSTQARQYLLEHSGTLFDPHVVEIFANIFGEGNP